MRPSPRPRRQPRIRQATPFLLALLAAVGCGDSGTAPEDGRVIAGVDLDALFAPPTAAEIAAIEAEWASRSPEASGVREEHRETIALGTASATVRVVSHEVDGHRHVGAVVAPDGVPAGSLPVLIYAHGGDRGVDLAELLLLAAGLGEEAAGFVYVVPSFRSETLRVGGETWRSGGEPSPWDRDVDDTMALLDVALESTSAADPSRVAVLGQSRGGGVALLLGIRDPRVDRVVELYGPTDFFGPYVQDIVERTLRGAPPEDLPGVTALDAAFLGPLVDGSLGMEAVRLELVRRSPVLFVDRLPPVQIHHGTADDIVAVGQAERLIAALEAAGRGPPGDDEWYLYPGGVHTPISLPGAFDRIRDFLAPLLG